MTFSRNFAIYLQLCGLAFLPTIRAQDSYTEASFPQPLLLKPGITQISGGVTTADQADAFHYRTSHPGSVTVRLRYQHRNANVIMGIRELPHLSGDLDFGYYVPSLPFFSSNLAPPATLSSPFYLTNGANTISATVPTVTDFDATARLRVSAPAGKTHPDYTVEIDYQPVLDPWEAGSGNESAPTAFVIDATTPGSLTGGTHSATDADWFRFTVPAGRSLQLRITSEVLSVPWEILPHQCVLHNASAIPLQTGNSGHVSFIENSGTSAQTYLLRITSQDSYAQEGQMSWGLQDTLEPNNTPAQASFLGTIQPQGRIEIPDLTLLDPDHFTVLSELPANTPILIAALPDPMISIQGGARVSIQSGGGTYQEYLNYTIVTTS